MKTITSKMDFILGAKYMNDVFTWSEILNALKQIDDEICLNKIDEEVCLNCEVPLNLHGTCFGVNNMHYTIIDCSCGGKILMRGNKIMQYCTECNKIKIENLL